MADGKLDGHSIAEQVIAGVILVGAGALGAHLYDKHHTKINRKIAGGLGDAKRRLLGKGKKKS